MLMNYTLSLRKKQANKNNTLFITGALGPTTHIETSLDGNNTTNAVEQQYRPNAAVDEESNVLRLVTNDKVRLTVVQFEREDPVLKWFLRIMSVLLIVCLAFLWIFYR